MMRSTSGPGFICCGFATLCACAVLVCSSESSNDIANARTSFYASLGLTGAHTAVAADGLAFKVEHTDTSTPGVVLDVQGERANDGNFLVMYIEISNPGAVLIIGLCAITFAVACSLTIGARSRPFPRQLSKIVNTNLKTWSIFLFGVLVFTTCNVLALPPICTCMAERAMKQGVLATSLFPTLPLLPLPGVACTGLVVLAIFPIMPTRVNRALAIASSVVHNIGAMMFFSSCYMFGFMIFAIQRASPFSSRRLLIFLLVAAIIVAPFFGFAQQYFQLQGDDGPAQKVGCTQWGMLLAIGCLWVSLLFDPCAFAEPHGLLFPDRVTFQDLRNWIILQSVACINPGNVLWCGLMIGGYLTRKAAETVFGEELESNFKKAIVASFGFTLTIVAASLVAWRCISFLQGMLAWAFMMCFRCAQIASAAYHRRREAVDQVQPLVNVD